MLRTVAAAAALERGLTPALCPRRRLSSARMSEVAPIILAVAALLTAAATLWVAIRNGQKATTAAEKATTAAELASSSAADVVKIGQNVYEIGARIDGRLSQLLLAEKAASRAEGRLEGRIGQEGEGPLSVEIVSRSEDLPPIKVEQVPPEK